MNDQHPTTPATTAPNQRTAAAPTEAASTEGSSASRPVMQHHLNAHGLILLHTRQSSLSDPDVIQRCNEALTRELTLDPTTTDKE